jgi:hypothetical protein
MSYSFLTQFLFCIILVQPNWTLGNDFLKDLLRCQANQTLSQQTGMGTVFLRTYPFNFQSLNVNQAEIPLASVLSSNALEAHLYEQLQRYALPQSKDGGDLPINADAVNLFLRSDTTPNALIVKRSNELTIFPRSFLAHPRIALLAIRNGDAIATVPANQDARNSEDVIYRSVFEPSKPLSNRFKKNIVAPNFIGKEVVQVLKAWNSNNGFVLKLASISSSASNILKSENIAMTVPEFPVFLIQRQDGPNLLNFVAPLKEFGPFSAQGHLFMSLYRDRNSGELQPENWKARWTKTFKGFEDLILADGDVIYFTDIRSVPLFRDIVY